MLPSMSVNEHTVVDAIFNTNPDEPHSVSDIHSFVIDKDLSKTVVKNILNSLEQKNIVAIENGLYILTTQTIDRLFDQNEQTNFVTEQHLNDDDLNDYESDFDNIFDEHSFEDQF